MDYKVKWDRFTTPFPESGVSERDGPDMPKQGLSLLSTRNVFLKLLATLSFRRRRSEVPTCSVTSRIHFDRRIARWWSGRVIAIGSSWVGVLCDRVLCSSQRVATLGLTNGSTLTVLSAKHRSSQWLNNRSLNGRVTLTKPVNVQESSTLFKDKITPRNSSFYVIQNGSFSTEC